LKTELQQQSHQTGPSKISYTDLEEAWKTLLASIGVSLDAERVGAWESYGRVAGEDIISPIDLPPYDSSHLDGYACRSQDLTKVAKSGEIRLAVVGKVSPGKFPDFILRKGESVRILTGSYLPRGADCVVGLENITEVDGGKKIVLRIPLKKMENVYSAGIDIRKNEVVIAKGNLIRGQDVSLLANLRIKSVRVLRKPRVGILSTGSELVDPFSGEDGIPETHSLLLKQLVDSAGGTARVYGIAEDNPMKLEVMLKDALRQSDMLLTIGGSSVGEADLVSETIDKLGKPGVLVHGIKLDPGRVAGFGVIGGKPIIICPGLVQSTLNAFIVLALPVIRKLLGFEPVPRSGLVEAQMSEDLVFRKRFVSFRKLTYLNLSRKDGLILAKPVVGETPMVSVLSKSNAYLITEADREVLRKGETVHANLLPGFSDDLILNG
jgi:molybdenum cofactor synthesis domain-containing protein